MPDVSAPISLRFALHTDVGRAREHQEDRMLAAANLAAGIWLSEGSTIGSTDNWGILLIIADGMGGMNAGEVAAQIAVDSVRRYFEKLVRETSNPDAQSPQQSLLEAMWYAQQQIVQLAAGKEELVGMGTTLVAAWLIGQKLHLLWVGDSRCYLWREGEGLRQLSKDHSLVQKLIDEKKITPEQAAIHPQRNLITQCLGMTGEPISPGYTSQTLQLNDCLLICTDGLNGMLSDEQILTFFGDRVPPSPEELTNQLVTAANEAGGSDNITLVVAHLVLPQVSESSEAPFFASLKNAKSQVMKSTSERLPQAIATKMLDTKPVAKKNLPVAEKRSRWWRVPLLLLSAGCISLLSYLTWFDKVNVLKRTLPEQIIKKSTDTLTGKIIGQTLSKDSLWLDTARTQSTQEAAIGAARGDVKGGYYYILTGPFSKIENVETLEKQLRQRYPEFGVARTVVPASDGEKWEVLLTGFRSKEDAENLKNRDLKFEKPLLSSSHVKGQ